VQHSTHSQDVNDWLQAAEPGADDRIDFLCECGVLGCASTVTATREQYLAARESPNQLLVASEHHDAREHRVVQDWGEILVVAPLVAAPG
jgi:hypothetical protein